MIVSTVSPRERLLVVGAVRGLADDAARIAGRLDAFAPRAVALALSEEELRGIREYFVEAAAEPLVSLTSNEVAEIRGLVRYGEVRVPNPAWTAALQWGLARGVPVEGVDPSDDAYATMFTDHIGYAELVRRTLRERSLTRHPPEPPTADEFIVAWAGRLAPGEGSAGLMRARDQAAAAGALALARRAGPTAIIVDRERFDGIVQALAGPAGPWPPPRP